MFGMTTIQIAIYCVLLISIVCLIAGLMEIYKKSLRKGKTKPWENYLIALILSIGSLVILVLSDSFKPVLSMIGADLWMDYVSYVILIYFMQFNVDKKIIKKIVRSFVSNFLEKTGLDEDQIKEILKDN